MCPFVYNGSYFSNKFTVSVQMLKGPFLEASSMIWIWEVQIPLEKAHYPLLLKKFSSMSRSESY